MTTANRTYVKRPFTLTYEKREPAGSMTVVSVLYDELGGALLDEAGGFLYDEGAANLGTGGDNEGMHYARRTLDLTFDVRDQ